MKRNWIFGIDLGSDKIAGAVGRMEGEIRSVFGAASVESRGIAKGVVTDLGKVSSAVKELVDRLEFQTNLRLEGALLATNGMHLEVLEAQGSGLSFERGREIAPRDLRRLLEQAQGVALPMNRDLLHILLQGYVVDGQEGIRNPVGMYATRLGVHLKMITGLTTFLQNATSAVNRAGLEVEGTVFSGYATALAVLEKEERESGCAFLEIGEGLSSLLLFQGGGVVHLAVFPAGGSLITEAVAGRFQIPLAEAKRLKAEQGSLSLPEGARDHDLLIHDGSRQKVIRRGALCDVIQEATETLFRKIRGGVRDIPFPGRTLVLSGGCALLDGMVEAAESAFSCRARLGEIQEGLSGKRLPVPFAAAVGLIRYGYEKQKEDRFLRPESPVGRALSRVRELFLDYF